MLGGLMGQNEQILQASLSGLSKRQQLVSNNLANIDTPGYRAADVPFEQVLAKKAARGADNFRMMVTSAGHMNPDTDVSPLTAVTQQAALQLDGNGVDLDAESEKLAETTIAYNAVTQLMNQRISVLKSAVYDGRR